MKNDEKNNPGTNGFRLVLSSHVHIFYVQVEWLELDSSLSQNEKVFNFSSKIRLQNVFFFFFFTNEHVFQAQSHNTK